MRNVGEQELANPRSSMLVPRHFFFPDKLYGWPSGCNSCQLLIFRIRWESTFQPRPPSTFQVLRTTADEATSTVVTFLICASCLGVMVIIGWF